MSSDLFGDAPAMSPYQRHSRPSKAAAAAVAPTTATLRQVVLNYLRACGIAGATDGEGEDATGMSGDTWRPRRVELERAGLVRDGGTTRLTRSGRQATVWMVTAEGVLHDGFSSAVGRGTPEL